MKIVEALNQRLEQSAKRTIEQREQESARRVVTRFARGSVRLQQPAGGLLTKTRLEAEVSALRKK